MKEDITEIGFDDIYGDLSLIAVLTDENCHNSGYVDENITPTWKVKRNGKLKRRNSDPSDHH